MVISNSGKSKLTVEADLYILLQNIQTFMLDGWVGQNLVLFYGTCYQDVLLVATNRPGWS